MKINNEDKNKIMANEKLVNDVYSDVLKPSLKKVGNIGENILKFVALPFTFLGLTAEELEIKYKNFISKTINKVPEEKRETPQSVIVSPLLDHIKYLFDAEDMSNLIDMFSALLANAIDKERKDNVHVSYVNTLCQLGSLEAKILMKMYESYDYYDCFGVVFRQKNSISENSYIKVLSDEAEPLGGFEEEQNVFFYYDLFLLEDDIEVSDKVFFEGLNILEHHNLISSFKVNKVIGEQKYTLEKHDINNVNRFDASEAISGYRLTQYGKDFMSVCINPITDSQAELICEKCDTVFVNIEKNAICPRCGGKAIKVL